MSAESEAKKQLAEKGIKGIRFTGRQDYKGKTQLLFEQQNGDPVWDAPIVIVNDDNTIKLLPWTDMLR